MRMDGATFASHATEPATLKIPLFHKRQKWRRHGRAGGSVFGHSSADEKMRAQCIST